MGSFYETENLRLGPFRVAFTVKSQAVDYLLNVAHLSIFRVLMKVKFDAYVLWPLAKRVWNWIVYWSTARNFTVHIIWEGHKNLCNRQFLWPSQKSWTLWYLVFINNQAKMMLWIYTVLFHNFFFKLQLCFVPNVHCTKIRDNSPQDLNTMNLAVWYKKLTTIYLLGRA